MTGRGLLGRWGPNHAADPIVTRYNAKCASLKNMSISFCINLNIALLFNLRWKVNSDGKHVQENGKPILEFVAIKRNDNGQWAIPGVSIFIISSFCFLVPL